MMDADAVLMFSSEDLSPFDSLNEVWMLNLRPSRAYCVLIKIKYKRKKRILCVIRWCRNENKKIKKRKTRLLVSG